MLTRSIRLLGLLLLLLSSTTLAQTVFSASDQSFSVRLPQGFGPEASPPANTVLAAEIPHSGINFSCTKGPAVDLEPELFAEQMKRNLYDAGAQLFGRSSAALAGRPAASFLVGGVATGKESLFVYNQRDDAVYTFILNYPSTQRDRAAGIWNQLAPTFEFHQGR